MSAASLKPRRFDRDVDGILLLDKPSGMTSNAALQRARGLYRALKAGHAGSLDPMATGMLPICFGQATKICGFLLDSGKTYRFVAKLGERTDTGDAEGTVLESQPIPELSQDRILAVLKSFLGEQEQVPPMYSALKVDGERLYKKARRGETIDRESRTIRIDALDLVGFEPDRLDIQVRCSKGTYVRTLAEDIAAALGTVGHLIALRRIQVDPFGEGPMHTLEALESATVRSGLDALLIPPDRALDHLPSCTVNHAGERAILQGQSAVPDSAVSDAKVLRIYGPGGRFLGLGEATPEAVVQPRRLLVKSTINP